MDKARALLRTMRGKEIVLHPTVGGVLTGRGADVLIIDDPLKPDEALSDLQRRIKGSSTS